MNAPGPRPGPETVVIRLGRGAVLLVLVVAVLDWVGWATGVEALTRIVPTWPPMTPRTALWLATLGIAVLLWSRGSPPARTWAARALAVAVGASAVAVLAEYATQRSFGVDLLWFGPQVAELQSSWPGRPSPLTALSALLVAAVVALPRATRWTRRTWAVCMVAALVTPGVAVVSYLFDAVALVTIAESTGMAIATALCLVLLAVAALLLRPDRIAVSWLLSRPNRRTVIQLGLIVASFPVLVGVTRRAFLALGFGELEGLTLSTTVGTVIVGTMAIFYAQRIAEMAEHLRQQTEQLTTELQSAAAYVSSLLPDGLTGEVDVASCYQPSRELGGDCFDYRWIDDEHLTVYLIDVSGHGIEPALLAVSVHNMLRSGSFSDETLLTPEAVLAGLNQLFRMEEHNDHYFTMWYGVYEASTRTLRYSSAGAPPALAFASAAAPACTAAELSTPSAPIGMFDETEFTSDTYRVPPGCRILVYSDGASEIPLVDGRNLSLTGFKSVLAELALSPQWSLHDLTDRLRTMTPAGGFEDDCSMVQLMFP
ncbi:PP2C family protein-serine/threonine phosphatase [Mycolicibacterium palauense]|uniref:PP2C family protein-serine/threonine phosphatase n=1 Tax=Mycolicibacterium palauense TaxID=2034511 RepID=UPI00159BDBFB|nr:PP2C family protein-serine/threonine phosphatase [Mycolicibacterium palauense]